MSISSKSTIPDRDGLNRLIDEVLDVVNSDKNRTRKEWWANAEEPWYRDMWRGIPKKSASCGIPITVAPDNSLWSHILGVDLRNYYNNPLTHLETQLKMKIYHFKNFNDDTYFSGKVHIWFGVITELSYFGAPIKFFSNREGWIDPPPVLADPKALDAMEPPDFYKSGLMPKVHEFYSRIREVVDERLEVMFPSWARGPFCIAAHLRGMENLLMDMVLNPEFVHRLMRFVVDSEKAWMKERSKFLGEPMPKGKLYNDEIDFPTLSTKLYREFVLPYEKELSEFYGGITYWHSCGTTTRFFEGYRRDSGARDVPREPLCGLWEGQGGVRLYGHSP